MADQPFYPPENYYRISLKALVFDDKGRLLVCNDSQNEWAMPGGGWDHAEDYESGVKREVAEELGTDVISVGPIAFFYRCQAQHGQPKVSLAFPVKLRNFNFKFNPDDDEVTEVRFVTKEEFLQLPFQVGEAPIQKYANQIWQLVEKNGKNK